MHFKVKSRSNLKKSKVTKKLSSRYIKCNCNHSSIHTSSNFLVTTNVATFASCREGDEEEPFKCTQSLKAYAIWETQFCNLMDKKSPS